MKWNIENLSARLSFAAIIIAVVFVFSVVVKDYALQIANLLLLIIIQDRVMQIQAKQDFIIKDIYQYLLNKKSKKCQKETKK